MNQTKTDILNNPNVCLAVFNQERKGAKIIGKAEYFDNGEWLDKVKAMPENEGLPAKGAIVICAEQIIDLK
jgi:predicted pyridoxine 5'-phosphate oxidase superfamily flavin-nucleotide-binding protein